MPPCGHQNPHLQMPGAFLPYRGPEAQGHSNLLGVDIAKALLYAVLLY